MKNQKKNNNTPCAASMAEAACSIVGGGLGLELGGSEVVVLTTEKNKKGIPWAVNTVEMGCSIVGGGI